MLQVLDNGVKIQLNASQPTANNFTAILVSSGLLLVVGVAIMFGLTLAIAVPLALMIIAGAFFWQKNQAKHSAVQPKLITGGEVTITPTQIEHISSSGQRMVYPLPQQIAFTQADNQLLITDKAAQPLLTIQGFSQPQHANIAQAVLQGKSIKTQGKAIRMQES